MAGVSVQESGLIYLGDTYFKILGPVRVGNITATPNPVLFGDTLNRTGSQLMTQLSQSSYVGGVGIHRGNIRTHTERCWTSQLETRYRNWLTLPPVLTVTAPAVVLGEGVPPINFGLTQVYSFFGTKVYPITGITTGSGITYGALDYTLPGIAEGRTTFRDNLYVGCGLSGYSYRTTAGAWTNSAACAANDFAVWDNKLYALHNTGAGYYELRVSLDGVAWTSKARLFAEDQQCRLFTWVDSAGASALYVITGRGVKAYDAVNDLWVQTALQFASGGWSGKGSATVSPQDGKLYASNTTSRTIVQAQAGNPLTLAPIGLDRDDGRPIGLDMVSYSMTSDANGVYLAGVTTSGSPEVWCYLWGGWHYLASLGTLGPAPSSGVGIIYIGGKSYLMIPMYTASFAGGTMAAIELPNGIVNPKFNAAARYAAGPFQLITPWWDFGEPLTKKNHGHIFVEVENCSSTEKVIVYYGKDLDDNTLTSVQTITADGLYDITVGTASGNNSRFFRYAFSMERGGDTSKAPRMRFYTAEVMPLLPASFAYNFEISLAEPVRGKSTKDQLAALKRLSDPSQSVDRIQMAYTDKDTGALQTFWGKILRVQGVENPDMQFKGTGQYTISFGVPYPQDTE